MASAHTVTERSFRASLRVCTVADPSHLLRSVLIGVSHRDPVVRGVLAGLQLIPYQVDDGLRYGGRWSPGAVGVGHDWPVTMTGIAKAATAATGSSASVDTLAVHIFG